MTAIAGVAVPFGVLSHPLPAGYRERVRPGAFSEWIRNGEVLARWEHKADRVLGSQQDGRLKLWEGSRGLRFELEILPAARWAELLLGMVRRGEISASIGFDPIAYDWIQDLGCRVRELREGRLWEISLLLREAAYPGTQVSVRYDPWALDHLRRRLELAAMAG